MNYSLINGNYNQFKSQLDELLKYELDFPKKNLSTLEKNKLKLKDWENRIEKTLIENITPNPDFLIDIYNYSKYSIISKFEYDYGYGMSDTIEKKIIAIENEIKKKKIRLSIVIDYVSIANDFIGNENEKPIDIQEKIDFILIKLKSLFNDNYYSIKTIFTLNSIEHRNDEPEEISEILHKRGYIIKKEKYMPTDEVKISIKGASYIERKTKTKKKKNSNSNINSKINKIIEKLNELGFGQEIIFNELEELRDLQSKLPKKTWGQLVKGKLLDLALAEIINKETATYIFESLTNENFKLLK